jgi:hypothetical protein
MLELAVRNRRVTKLVPDISTFEVAIDGKGQDEAHTDKSAHLKGQGVGMSAGTGS